jgi:hypothetical protein
MDINPSDTVLTLTSGGCNALNLLLHGAGHVVSVDCNPAQSSLLELKRTAIAQLPYEDVWKMFGEGRCAAAPFFGGGGMGPGDGGAGGRCPRACPSAGLAHLKAGREARKLPATAPPRPQPPHPRRADHPPTHPPKGTPTSSASLSATSRPS